MSEYKKKKHSKICVMADDMRYEKIFWFYEAFFVGDSVLASVVNS